MQGFINSLEMLEIMRKRKTVAISIDEVVIQAIKNLAEESGDSFSRFIEKQLFDLGKASGKIPSDEKRLGERRGGRRDQNPDEVEN